jgi:hypothetical protein
MESLVVTLRSKQQRKGWFYSTFASLSVILVFGYIVASFFTWSSREGDVLIPGDASSDDIRIQIPPKFLAQSFFIMRPP